MDKKKGIILAVVIFLLIGLGTFVFANPSEESLNGNDNNSNNTNNTNDNENLDDENTNDGDGEEGEDENTPNDVAQNEDPTDVIIGGGDSQTNTSGEENGNGEESQPSNPADTSAPIVTILGKTYQGLGNTIGFVNTDVRLFVTEGNLTVEIVDEEGNSISFTDGMTLSNDGTYKISVSDASGNTTEVELSIDQSAPVISGILNGTITNTVGTITVDDVNEVTVLLNGSEVELDQIVNHLVQGVNTITATDSLGNESKISFTYDTEAIKVEWLYTLNATYHNTELADKHYKVIGDGQDLYVELVFTEEFESIPAITVGNGEAVNMSCSWTNWETERQYYKCDATITIDGAVQGLVTGENIPIKITNIFDKAGNETVLNNDNITSTNKYGVVKYDKEAPVYESLGILNLTHLRENNAGANESLKIVNIGDEIRVLLRFNEILVVNPTIIIGNKSYELELRTDYNNFAEYTYTVDIKITEDMQLEDGKVNFEITGYADAAGNSGDKLTLEKINNKKYSGVELDTTAPERGYSTLGFEYTDSKDKEYVVENDIKYYYVKENDSFLYKIAFNEQIQDGLIATIGGKEIQLSYLDYSEDLGYIYGAEYVVPSGLEENSKLEIIISNIKDLAGNEYEGKTIIDVPTGNSRVAIYDSENPEINVYKWPKKDHPSALKKNDTFNYCVVAEASDISGLSSFTIDGKDYTPGENAYICDDGAHVFKAIDKAGNSNSFEFNIDITYGAVTINNKDAYNTHDLENTHYYNEITSVTFSEEGTVRLTKDDKNVYYGSTEEFNYEFTDGVYKFELFDKGGNPTAFMFEVDSVLPTATIEYSIEDRTNEEVVATLKPSEEVTITNNNGKDTYTFSENGTFTFEFVDRAGNEGTATAAVDWINNEIPTVKEIKYITNLSNNSVTVTATLSKPIYTPSGWAMDGKAYVFKREYNTNANETVEIKDLYGNTNSFEIDINWLEFTSPTVKEIKYITNLSNNSVTVTATLSKPIYTPSGWTMDGKAYVFKKEYNTNVNDTVEIKDLSDNTNKFNINISWLK